MKYSQISHTSYAYNEFRKPKKQNPNSVSNLYRRFNQIYKNSNNLHPESIYRQLLALTLKMAQTLQSQKNKKTDLVQILMNNLMYGCNLKSSKIVVLNTKISAIYLRSNLSVSSIRKYLSDSSIQNQSLISKEEIFINLHYLNQLQNKNYLNLGKKAIQCFLSIFSFSSQNQVQEQAILNQFFIQAQSIKSFQVFADVLSNYLRCLLAQSSNFIEPKLQINMLVNSFLQLKSLNSIQIDENKQLCQIICYRYSSLFMKPSFRRYMKLDAQKTFMNLINLLQKLNNPESDKQLTNLVMALFQSDQVKIVFGSRQLQPLVNYSFNGFKQALQFLSILYVHLNKQSICQKQKVWSSILCVCQRNIKKIIQNNRQFIYIISKIINKIQQLKNNFILPMFITQNIIRVPSKQILKTMAQSQVLIKIMGLFIANPLFSTLTNRQFQIYMPPNIFIQVSFRWVECLNSYNKKNASYLMQTILGWLQRINPQDKMYIQTIQRFLYLFTLGINTPFIKLSLQCLKIIISWQGFKPHYCLNQDVVRLQKKLLEKYQSKWRSKINHNYPTSQYDIQIQICLVQVAYMISLNILQNISKQNYYSNLKADAKLKQLLAKTIVIIALNKAQFLQERYQELKNIISSILKTHPQSKQLFLFSLQFYLNKILVSKYQIYSGLIIGFIQFYSQFNCLYERNMLDNFNIISFLIHIKKTLVYTQFQYCSTEIQNEILVCQKKLLNTSLQNYIKQIKFSKNQNDIELMVSVLAKKAYINIYCDQKASIQLQNQLHDSQNEFTQIFQQGQNNQNGEKLKNQQQDEFLKCQVQFQNSCLILSKIKKECLQIIPIIQKRLNHFISEVVGCWKLEIYQVKINQFKNILSFLKLSWNLIWILWNLDMKQKMNKIVSLRLGVLYSICNSIQNHDSFYLQATKKMFFNLLPRDAYLKYNPKSQNCKDLINLFKNQKIDINKLTKVSRFQKLIYVYNNINSHVNCKNIVGYLVSYIFDTSKGSFQISKVLKDKIPIINYITKFSILNREARVTQSLKSISQHFLQVNQWQICYPLLTLTIIKLLKFLKMHNQLSQMRSILKIANIYFSKVGNLNYYHQIVQCLFLKKHSPNILKIIDCYKTVMQSYNSKAFLKIDKIFTTKRRSMSTNFNTKIISNLIKDAIYSQQFYRQSVSKIILYYFKDQFNLQLYEVKAIQSLLHKYQEQNGQNKIKTICKTQKQLRELSYDIVQNKKQVQSLKKQFLFQRLNELTYRLGPIAYQNYKNGLLLQSIIGFYLETISQKEQLTALQNQMCQHLIKKIAILMMDFNYQFKNISYHTQQFLLGDEIQIIAQKLHLQQQLIKNLSEKSLSNLQYKIKYLEENLAYSLSIIYPIKGKIYNLTFYNGYFVSSIDRFDFQDIYSTFLNLIKNGQNILKIVIDKKQWWVSRSRIDRQLGKISQNVNLGIFDSKVQIKDKKYSKLLSYSQNLTKFIGFNQKYYLQHLQQFLDKAKINQNIKKQIKKQLNILNQLNDVNALKKSSLLIYVYDKYFQFPFENQKQVKNHQGVYRLPSISYLIQNSILKRSQFCLPKFNMKSVSYLVNTLNDLQATEKSFYQIKTFTNLKTNDWIGQIGMQPSASRMKQLLLSNEVFLYMGHGTGFAHLRQKQLCSINIKNLIMLFGCASIDLTKNNSEFHGISMMYLMNGCRSLLGCLWNVTDKDTDSLTKQMFSLLKQKSQNTSALLQKCKSKMKMRYLNGCALVMLGLPSQLYCK